MFLLGSDWAQSVFLWTTVALIFGGFFGLFGWGAGYGFFARRKTETAWAKQAGLWCFGLGCAAWGAMLLLGHYAVCDL